MGYRKRVLGSLACVAILALLQGCTTGQVTSANGTGTTESSATGTADQSIARPESPEATTSAATTVDAAPASTETVATAAVVNTGEYRISPRDILDIGVFQVPDLNKSVQVNQDGSISLPLVGKVAVGGKTTVEAEQLIGDKLRKSYLQSPQVSVSLKQYGQRITVNGEVKQPRVLSMDGDVTLAQAIANSGGLSELANSHRIHVARQLGGGRIQDDVYDLEAIQAGRVQDPPLKGGDIIVAEQSGTQVALKNVKDLLPFAIFASIF